MTITNTKKLSSSGVSIWLDDISRTRLDSGSLAELIRDFDVVGVTTNPAIFASAITSDDAYLGDLAAAAKNGLSPAATALELACQDVSKACDQLQHVYAESDGKDGFVSIEVEPRLAHDTSGTVQQAKELWQKINKPNLMIKIPATKAGIAAFSEVIAAGINVNVTLIFSVKQYQEVIAAYISGLQQARQNGHALERIASVASFFVSRFDSAVDPLLESSSDAEKAAKLLNKSAVANARIAYDAFLQSQQQPEFEQLRAAGANLQRPLWASTGVKDKRLSPIHYVTELVAKDTVNTMPESTLLAVADAEQLSVCESSAGCAAAAKDTIAELADLGISYDAITAELESEGLDKFTAAWDELLAAIATKQNESV